MLDVIEPATEDRLGEIADATDAEVDRAIEIADQARRRWCAQDTRSRAVILHDVAAVIRRDKALYAEHPDVLIPDNLVSSAGDEPGTPYWFTTRKQGITLTEGQTVDLGVLKLKIHGVNGVRAVLGHGGRGNGH